MLIKPHESLLLVIDMQERLVPAMLAPARTLKNAALLIETARELDIPVVLTEQYPKGLGSTVAEIDRVAGDSPVFPKLHFSCMQDPTISGAVQEKGRRQVILAGMEAHICVVQTAASLLESGYEVFVASDATASRSSASEEACLHRLSAAGVGIVTSEMVVFEWLGMAGTPAFKKILPKIK
ncbi:MAG: hydrolase [Rhizobiaceae bacterium]